jgi:YVTN family beta-propeller protein
LRTFVTEYYFNDSVTFTTLISDGVNYITVTMKNSLIRYSVFCLLSGISISLYGQETNLYLTEWDSLDLSGSSLPVLMPYNRVIDPAGVQIYFGSPELENHALDCALSPDRKTLAIQGRYRIIFYDIESRRLISELIPSNEDGLRGATNTYSGIKWYRRGEKQYLLWSLVSQRTNSYVIRAAWDGHEAVITNKYQFMPKAPAPVAIPNEVEVIRESLGDFFYVALNGNNQVVKVDIENGAILWEANVGVAPYGLVAANGKLFVTNWAGGIPDETDANVAGVPWGSAKVDPVNGSTREGSVSVLDPATGKILNELTVGLHPNDIVKSPDENFIYVANANSDHVSVIDTRSETVKETISVRLLGDENPFWGSSPNGLAVSGNGKTLYVANGMENAIAVVNLGNVASLKSKTVESVVQGFIPTGAYPGAVCLVNRELFVANIEAEGARIADNTILSSGDPAYNSHLMKASVSRITIPGKKALAAYSERVVKANLLFRMSLSLEEPRKDIAPVTVPARIGEPSVFKHVVYIIKENRTYDQVLGDMPQGDGEPGLCVFGEEITPNTHRLSSQFMLLDNYYVSGKSSAEGHQWTDASIVTDNIEKNMRAWFRSYPHVQTDALVYSPTGFIWDNAVRGGKSVRIYGEACIPKFNDSLNWTGIYNDFLNDRPFIFTNITTIQPVEALLSPTYPGYDHHAVPDVLRARAFIDELNAHEQKEGDQWPELSIIALPNDHTAGTSPGFPTPRAMVADNDVALGQIIEAITKSRFWENTVIFVTEDDSQAGWDHVSAYRTVGLVISPYTQTQTTNSTQYNQTSMVRTIEQILGLRPMNIMDATAMPMFDCFVSTPDYTTYSALKNKIPLDEMNPELNALSGKALYYARKSMEPQYKHVDGGDDQLMNRIIWYALKGRESYPKAFADGANDDDDH